jgi:hypothetical protein
MPFARQECNVMHRSLLVYYSTIKSFLSHSLNDQYTIQFFKLNVELRAFSHNQ